MIAGSTASLCWPRAAPRPAPGFLGKTPPKKKKNKRGRRSELSTLTRAERGTVRRAEQIIARAEEAHQREEEERRAAQARGSTRPQGQKKTGNRPRSPEQGPTPEQRRQVFLRSQTREPEPPRQEVRLRARAEEPRQETQLRLKSVAPERQQKRAKAQALRLAVNTARNRWEGSRFHTRVQLLRNVSQKAPKGSVTQEILGQFGDPCSICDERNTASKPVRIEFSQRRLGRKDQGSERARERNYAEPETDHRESTAIVLETALTRAKRRIAASRRKAKATKEPEKKKETRPFPRIRDVLIQEEEEEEDPGSDVDFTGDDSPEEGTVLQQQQLLQGCH